MIEHEVQSIMNAEKYKIAEKKTTEQQQTTPPSTTCITMMKHICSVCGEKAKFRCASCRAAFYCGRAHQIQHWQNHRGLCRRRKAAGEIRNSRCHRIDAIIDRRRGGQLLHHLKPKPVGKKPGRFVAHDRRSFSKSVVLIERIAQDLAMRGFSVIDHFAGETLVDAILRDVFQLYFQKHKFNPGTLSADCSQNARDKQKVRGDMVMWLDTNTNSTTHAAVRSAEMSMSELVHGLNGTDILHGSIIRSRSSVMAACYPGNGAGYKRHVDNPSNDGRKLTSILYLNKDYNRARDGGVLRMYPRNDDRHYDIDPTGGRLVLFWSDHRNPHEVLPSYWERFAISVWYFDIIERARSFVKSFQTCQLTK